MRRRPWLHLPPLRGRSTGQRPVGRGVSRKLGGCVLPPPQPSPSREEGACLPLSSQPRNPSAVRRVEREVLGDLALPAVAVREQPLLVVVKLLARLGGELEVGPLDNGIDRAGLLAEAAIDALHHV